MMPRAAKRAIAGLDTALARTGELIKIGRLHDAPDGDQVAFYCENIPASVRLIQPQDVVVANLPDSVVIISPTHLAARQWPVPPRVDDRIWITDANGRELTCNVQSVIEQRIGGVVVRYQITVKS
jgi:hypothetical protein